MSKLCFPSANVTIARTSSTAPIMTQYFNGHEHKSRRQAARAAMPRAEVLLWSKLKNRQLLGCKFRRQYGIQSYRLDFYSPELKLGIELNGETPRPVWLAGAHRRHKRRR